MLSDSSGWLAVITIVTRESFPKETFEWPYFPSLEAHANMSPMPAVRKVLPSLSVYFARAG